MNEPIKIKELASEGEKDQSESIRVRTEAKALSEDASWRHVLLSFYLGEVEGAGEDQNVHQVDDALQEGDRRPHHQALGGLNVLQIMLDVERGTFTKLSMGKEVKKKKKKHPPHVIQLFNQYGLNTGWFQKILTIGKL